MLTVPGLSEKVDAFYSWSSHLIPTGYLTHVLLIFLIFMTISEAETHTKYLITIR